MTVAPSPVTPINPWWVLPGLAVVVETIFVVALVMAFLGEDKTLLNVMCTAAIAQGGIVTSYFYGSSAGSAKKDDAATATSLKQNETIATQGAALAVSTPVPPSKTTTTTEVVGDTQAGNVKTTTETEPSGKVILPNREEGLAR